ncbi:MAG: poly(3-hydroxybutyrate) depolymerase [Clostridia bacterium]
MPALGAQREVTVSGVSSGAYMAVQMHVAHSAMVKGAGAIAGGPYYCAQGSLWTAYYNCMAPGAWTPLPSLAILEADARGLARAGGIDPLANLAGAPVWLFTGTRDRTVLPEVVRALDDWYRAFKARTLLVADKPAGHAMVVEQAKNACGATQPPFINDCDYDAAGELLKHLLGSLRPPMAPPTGRLVAFDQEAFAGGKAAAISLDATGWLYVPKDCEGGGCRVHVAFHGCLQGYEKVGDAFIAGAGYNRWADANRLLVLYPQAVARDGWSPGSFTFAWNPKGCWDWWGYTGAEYATKQGAQIRAVTAMLERLSEKPAGPR